MSGTSGRADYGSDRPPTKTIIVYRNGDAFFPGRKIVVNPRQVATFDHFLSSVTAAVEAPFGAVRKLFTPRQGRRVLELHELTHGSVYVAAGNEKFKELDYCRITIKKPQSKKIEQIRPVVHSKIVVSARWRATDESCTINVFTNGEVLVPPVRIRIPKHTLRSWDNVLVMVSEKVRLRTGAVYRLCRLDGHAVCGSTELENNQYYVAVGAKKFKALPYDQRVPNRDSSRENHRIEGQNMLPAIRKTRLGEAAFAHTDFGEDPEHTARGQMKKYTEKPERTKQQRQVSRHQVLFPTGEGSVFNAQNKRSEMAGATEVQEDGQLKVDMPIDQVEAEIVDVEEYEDGRCSTALGEASFHDSDGLCPQTFLRAGSRKDCSLPSGHVESVKKAQGAGPETHNQDAGAPATTLCVKSL